MAEDSQDAIRLYFMQDLLPVGIAMFRRVRNGGPKEVIDVFQNSTKPFEELREEGQVDAESLRQRLDQVSPGLGNPVVPVTVQVDDTVTSVTDQEISRDETLMNTLERIELRLDLLESYFRDDLFNNATSLSD